MRVVAITRVFNEADIVEAFARHTAAFVDHHFFLDNGSTDQTTSILGRLASEGLKIDVHRHASVSFEETKQYEALFRLSMVGSFADWVIPLDTDEFLDFQGVPGDFRSALSHQAYGVCSTQVREYVPTPEDDARNLLVPSRVVHARPLTSNSKVLMRGSLLTSGAAINPGAHSIQINGLIVTPQPMQNLTLAHYAVRSPWQWISKFAVGWSKVVAAGEEVVEAGHSYHYRAPFQLLKTAPAEILRNAYFMERYQTEGGLLRRSLTYRGGQLRYTSETDHVMRALSVTMAHLERLSLSHGRLLQSSRKRSRVSADKHSVNAVSSSERLPHFAELNAG